ncbi:MAG: MBL fold metallo-hydrolase [Planctomycetota bacterium]
MARYTPAQPLLFAQIPADERFTSARSPAEKKRASRTGLALCVLGSGSGGNCTAVRLTDSNGNREAALLDAGFGIRRTTRKLHEAGLGWRHIKAVMLSHLDRDHFKPTLTKALVEHRVTVHLHHWHLDELARARGTRPLFEHGLVEPFGDGVILPMPGVTATTTRLQHDRQGTIGYRLSTRFGDIGFATDLGHAPSQLIEHFAGVDVLCIESNYDERMTVNSSRPVWVNRRNLSDSGHLSNEQAYDAVQAIRDKSPHGNPRHVVLLHRSQQCNHPTKVRRVFERDAELAKRVTLTDQRKRTRWIQLKPLREVQRRQIPLAG